MFLNNLEKLMKQGHTFLFFFKSDKFVVACKYYLFSLFLECSCNAMAKMSSLHLFLDVNQECYSILASDDLGNAEILQWNLKGTDVVHFLLCNK